jgi:DNA polymerase III sliding clamp (beta) subunit (PCNA family)
MKVNRKEFLQLLNRLLPGVSVRDLIPQTQCFIFNKGEAFTFNDCVCIKIKTALQLNCAIQAKELYLLISKIEDEEIEIEQKGNTLVIATDTGQGTISIQDIAISISHIPDPLHSKIKWIPISEDEWNQIYQGLSVCVHTVSSDYARAKLTCVHFKKNKIESSDGNNVTLFEVDSAPSESFMIPEGAVRALLQFDSFDQYGVVHKKDSPLKYVFFMDTDSGMVLSFTTYDELYLNFEKQGIYKLCELKGEHIQFRIRSMLSAVERARIFTKDMEFEEKIHISMDSNCITIQGQGEKGKWKEKMRSRHKGKEVSFQIPPSTLLYLLKDREFTEGVLVDYNKILFKQDNLTYITMVQVEE